jgi:hypothetical protein
MGRLGIGNILGYDFHPTVLGIKPGGAYPDRRH